MKLVKFSKLTNTLHTLKRINSSKGSSSNTTKYKSKLPLQLQYKTL